MVGGAIFPTTPQWPAIGKLLLQIAAYTRPHYWLLSPAACALSWPVCHSVKYSFPGAKRRKKWHKKELLDDETLSVEVETRSALYDVIRRITMTRIFKNCWPRCVRLWPLTGPSFRQKKKKGKGKEHYILMKEKQCSLLITLRCTQYFFWAFFASFPQRERRQLLLPRVSKLQ